ncbi:putative SAM-dependent methyltransferase [Acinetobacter gerneri DSM 14967 = CIP 107464 = MTCC 9824]|uniref:Methyltransferase type 11 domain-containing protein n=2 Tax=Acinetobacter gerneri TaxID=202952 RepID=N8ZKD1_9GAMM|nr:hypothetical protein F960_03601 [Acinetobacter gerneri DSM 14967 = CIP 107464 = MTCC 9824]EPR81021.1 putative SAM-dependent methyltransferase [Acinetobacter gerneri DSM 14967 = CIP 107464 = MTCC 9824]
MYENMPNNIHHAAQQGFSSAAELYQQTRPSYPQEIKNWLESDLKINKNSTVIDLGSGTGKFLPYLIAQGSEVIAVEPVTEMLEQLRKKYPSVKSVQASSEQLPFHSESIDAVLCAQSFHWFANIETLNEIHQVLKPKGHLGLIWNQRDVEIDWVKALADYIAQFEGDTPRYHSDQWKKVFENQFLFELTDVKVYSQLQKGTVENVVSNRLLSTSFIAAMSQEKQLEMKQNFEKIVFDFTGKTAQDEIEFPYITYAYHFHKI